MSHRVLQCVELSASYTADLPVLRSATLRIAPAKRLALLGANGSGKSTLLSCLAGSTQPISGQISVDGEVLRYTRRGLRSHRQAVQLVLQDPNDQLFSADVTQDVSFGPANLGLTITEVKERVAEALDLLGLQHLHRVPTHHLSFGEKKRVAIAGAVAMRPCVLLLDEPTAGLDPQGVEEMLEAVARLEQHDTTIVIATHDVAFALEWADTTAVMLDGAVVTGKPTDLLADEALLRAARLKRPWSLRLADALVGAGLLSDGARPRTVEDVTRLLLDRPVADGIAAKSHQDGGPPTAVSVPFPARDSELSHHTCR
ncbi:energy-coupling factor ABC transporter ATP-binding protein [Rhodococcoides fascians]|uniref:energy-coupling factor ABC transporter ATP-binding protein n=1 Tax=Rhodococcoides fascians TaxID=1828 RepID=UPI000932AE7D|nr:ATP-binding cassette domain-containing protein [Rhodococcus fascians]